jgi:hypothetical protein
MFVLNYKKNMKYMFVLREYNLQKVLLFKFLENLARIICILNFSLFSKNKFVYLNLLEFLKKCGLI